MGLKVAKQGKRYFVHEQAAKEHLGGIGTGYAFVQEKN